MRSEDGVSLQRLSLVGHEDTVPKTSIDDLPPEILGTILDHLLGHLASISSTRSYSTPQASKSVASVMRHPRRKALSDIALVSRVWRKPVQERIYRHIKIKGTRTGLDESADWFINHMHLSHYVRHIEVWIPVWGDRTAVTSRPLDEEPLVPNMETARQFDGGMISPDVLAGTLAFKLASYNATLAEVFQHVGMFFQGARIFTLEGGHCKRSRLIQTFPAGRLQGNLYSLPQIRTFVMKGTWNLMRDPSRWQLFERALPNVQEWHCGYARPQFEAYATMNDILSTSSLSTIRHLNINLEGFYSKDPTLTSSHPAQRASFHLCHQLGGIAHRLESIVFGGKICSAFFLSAWKTATRAGTISCLRSIDVGVKNCCRPRCPEDEAGDAVVGDSASITSMSFIQAFDNMVTAAVFTLSAYPLLRYLRIRFIDLDSACPLLNPYFQLSGGTCTGLWNEEILEMLSQFRPGVFFEELSDGIYAQARKDGDVIAAIYPRSRPKSIKSSSYKLLAESRL